MDTGLKLSHLLAFLAASGVSWGMTWAMRAIAGRIGAYARRDSRRRHERDTPLLGGGSFYVVLCIATAVAFVAPELLGGHLVNARFALCFIGAISLIFGVGVIDDLVELKAPPKFAAQFAAAALILFAQPHLPTAFQGLALPEWVIGIALALWIVGITNAMNMIDGMDGLCAGIAGLSALTLAGIMITTGSTGGFALFLSLGLAGACAGFLFHNFNPARIFLGDSGSMLIGFVLAVVSIRVDVRRSLFVSLGMPIFLLGLPLLDVGLSVIRRGKERRSPFAGDRGHLHHRLQQMGISHRAAVLVLWFASAYLDLVALILAHCPVDQSYYVYAAVVPMIAFWMATLYFIERRLTFQLARFGQLFLRQENSLFAGRAELASSLRVQLDLYARSSKPFTLVVLESRNFLRQMAHERPTRVVEFFMSQYSILRNRLRGSDLIARLSEHTVVVLLPGAGESDGSEESVIAYLAQQIKSLQESYQVFQSNGQRPEGFEVLRYPRDEKRIKQMAELAETCPIDAAQSVPVAS